MGGLAGHMSHLYENPRLTFNKLKEIFQAAAEGEIEGTEKTDGQNLYLSFSVPDQKMEFTDDDGPGRAARNKTNIKSGGLTVKQVVDKFADHPNQKLKKSFSQALRAFERVVQSFPREKQVEIFGPDTNIYYNAEIINPDTPNVINYDKKLVTIHRGGGGYFDKETGSPEEIEERDPETGELIRKERDISKNAETLSQELENIIQDMESQGGFEVIMDAVQKLKSLDNKEALRVAMTDLDSEISSEGISDDQMIIEYVMARILTLLRERGINLDTETESSVLKRLLLKNPAYRQAYGYDKMPSELAPSKILKDLPPREKNKVIDVLNNSRAILKQAIQPIEHIVHDFSVAMLEGLESLFILDNKKGVERIRQKVQTAKKEIEQSGVKENIKILLQQMDKLKSIENISTAAEGFVFDYDGWTYKFTGNFAPINQILGIGKYDNRGKLPTLEESLISEVVDLLLKEEEKESPEIIYIPGGFKPPHKGHWNLIQTAAALYPNIPIRIITGEKGRGNINFSTAKKIWDIYIGSDMDVEVVNFTEDGSPNPWRWIADREHAPKSFAIVYSSKDQAYKKIVDAMNAVPIEVGACEDEDKSCPLSATNFRDMGLKDRKIFKSFMPTHISDEDEDRIWNILGGSEDNVKVNITEEIFSLIEEILEEKYESGGCTHKKTGKSGCKVTFKTGKKKRTTACYKDCGTAKLATSGGIKEEEELEEVSGAGAAGGFALPMGQKPDYFKSGHPKVKGIEVYIGKRKNS
jgi:hypothetical protein